MKLSDDEDKNKDVAMHKRKSRLKRSSKTLRKYSAEMIINETNKKELVKSRSRRGSVTMRVNTYNKGERIPKRQSYKSLVNNNQINTLDTKESFINDLGENKGYKYKNSKFRSTKVLRVSKNYINENGNEDENDNKNNNNNDVIIELD